MLPGVGRDHLLEDRRSAGEVALADHPGGGGDLLVGVRGGLGLSRGEREAGGEGDEAQDDYQLLAHFPPPKSKLLRSRRAGVFTRIRSRNPTAVGYDVGVEANVDGPVVGPYERILWSNPSMTFGSFDASPEREDFETAGAIGDRPAIAFSRSSVGIAQVEARRVRLGRHGRGAPQPAACVPAVPGGSPGRSLRVDVGRSGITARREPAAGARSAAAVCGPVRSARPPRRGPRSPRRAARSRVDAAGRAVGGRDAARDPGPARTVGRAAEDRRDAPARSRRPKRSGAPVEPAGAAVDGHVDREGRGRVGVSRVPGLPAADGVHAARVSDRAAAAAGRWCSSRKGRRT